jgi:hypothetical protein
MFLLRGKRQAIEEKIERKGKHTGRNATCKEERTVSAGCKVAVTVEGNRLPERRGRNMTNKGKGYYAYTTGYCKQSSQV